MQSDSNGIGAGAQDSAMPGKADLYPTLDAEFSEYLSVRGVPPDVANERGYRTVLQGSRKHGGDFAGAHGFPETASGMLIPLHGILDSDPLDTRQLRIHKAVEPNFTNAKGVRKFLNPQGQKNVLATHPRTRGLFSEHGGGIISEGITRIDALAAFGIPAVGTMGIFNWRDAEGLLPDFEALPIKDNNWILAPDGDVRLNLGVFEGAHRLKKVLEKKGAASVNIVALPDGMGLDDWIASKDFQAADALLFALKEYIIRDKVRPTAAVKIAEGQVNNNPHYRILGLEGEQVAIWIAAGQVLRRSREAMSSKATLISLAPLDYWETLVDGQQVGLATASRIGDSLLRKADLLGQVDTSRVTGRGAFALSDGPVGFHLGDRVLVNGKETAIAGLHSTTGTDLSERYWIAQPRIELTDSATDEELARFAKDVMAYRWGGVGRDGKPDRSHGRRFLGWMVAGAVGGALPWRPHLAFIAPSGEGKSWMIESVYMPVMRDGELTEVFSNITEAALNRLAGRGTIPIIIDEAEPSTEWVLRLLETLRIAAGGIGKRGRADGTADGVSIQTPKFSAMLSSTALPRLGKADASRLAPVTLGDEVPDWPGVKAGIEGSVRDLALKVRTRIILDVAMIAADVKALITEFEDLGMDAREAHISAALTAGWRFWGIDDKEVHATDFDEKADETPDAIRCVRAILERPFRLDGGAERSTSWVMAQESEIAQKLLADRLGIRRHTYSKVDSLCIWYTSVGLHAALRDTEWARSDLKRLLLAIPGATATGGVRYGSQGPQRSVVIPVESLKDAGIDMDNTDLPEHPQTGQQNW